MLVKTLIALSSLLFSQIVYAGVAVIVHPSNANNLDATQISRLFTGKDKTFANGEQAIPINQPMTVAVTDEFNEKVLDKSSSQIKAYWSKLVFSGKGTPPKEVGSAAEVIELVSKNPNTIGYVDSADVTDGVKVLATF